MHENARVLLAIALYGMRAVMCEGKPMGYWKVGFNPIDNYNWEWSVHPDYESRVPSQEEIERMVK